MYEARVAAEVPANMEGGDDAAGAEVGIVAATGSGSGFGFLGGCPHVWCEGEFSGAGETTADQVVLSYCWWDGEVWACFFVGLWGAAEGLDEGDVGDDGVEVCGIILQRL